MHQTTSGGGQHAADGGFDVEPAGAGDGSDERPAASSRRPRRPAAEAAAGRWSPP